MTADLAIQAALALGSKALGSGGGGVSQPQNLSSGIAYSPVSFNDGSITYAGGNATTSSGGIPTPAQTLGNGLGGAVSNSGEMLLLLGAAAFLFIVLWHG